MAAEAVSYHEDVERLRQQFVEFRQAHAVRSRLPEELWTAAAKLAGRDHSDGAGAGRGPAESAEVDGSIGAARVH